MSRNNRNQDNQSSSGQDRNRTQDETRQSRGGSERSSGSDSDTRASQPSGAIEMGDDMEDESSVDDSSDDRDRNTHNSSGSRR